MTLAGLQGQHLLFRPGVVLQAAAAHFTAEALMNVPRMLGSLELLMNPTGLLTSVSAGLEDLLGLPFAALVDASPAQVPCRDLVSIMYLTCCLRQGMRPSWPWLQNYASTRDVGALMRASC